MGVWAECNLAPVMSRALDRVVLLIKAGAVIGIFLGVENCI